MYGTPFDLPAIERKVAKLRSKKTLGYGDLQFFEAKEHWWFTRFWVFPPEHHVTPELAKRTFHFWNLPRNEREVIADLLDVFKSIELVSIILRFIVPGNYGIISPPVERVLDVRRGGDAVQTYLNYLSDLREIALGSGFKRAADADMALWVLHEKCFGANKDPEIVRLYLADPMFLRLRAKNLVLPLANLSYPKLAEALHNVKPELAALVACHTLEILIRDWAQYIAPDCASIGLAKLIEALPSYGPVDILRKGAWKRLSLVRNALIHEGRVPSKKETADLVAEVVRLEMDIRQLRDRGVNLRKS